MTRIGNKFNADGPAFWILINTFVNELIYSMMLDASPSFRTSDANESSQFRNALSGVETDVNHAWSMTRSRTNLHILIGEKNANDCWILFEEFEWHTKRKKKQTDEEINYGA
jgi:hypothetical protein